MSIATVSRVLNGQTNVATPTREKVQQALARRGANAPTPRAAPPPRRSGPVLLRCPYVLTDYFGIISSAVAQTLALHGRDVLLDAGEAAQRSPALSQLGRAAGPDGAVLILPPEPAGELVALRARGFPYVVVDPRTPLPRDIAAVSAAHAAGARSIGVHLVGLGHRRIGYIGGPTDWLASQQRAAGHRSALADAGVLPAPELATSVAPTIAAGHRAARRLLELANRPTALVCFNDKIAVGALRAAADLGLAVPADLSVTGFDDIDISLATRPLLSTVRQPLQEMGRMAVSVLMRMLERHDHEALHVELATELIVRDSTGPVPVRRCTAGERGEPA